MRSGLLLFIAGLFSLSAFGQTETVIKGTLKDPSGEGVVGASVYIKGTQTGTVSNLEGSFRLKTSMQGEQTLVISSVGMITIEKPVTLDGGEIELGRLQWRVMQ